MHVQSWFCQSKAIAFLRRSCRAKQTWVALCKQLLSYGNWKRATKTCNLFCKTAAKRVEKQCCAFCHSSSKPVLQQISRLLQVARILSSDWLELHGSHARNNIFVTCCKTVVCLGPVKRATCADFVAENRTSLYFLWKSFHNLQQSN